MRNRDYWAKRARLREAQAYDRMTAALPDLDAAYRKVVKSIEGQIGTLYARYADEYGVSLEDARKCLTYRESAAWLKDVKQLIRDIRDKADGWEAMQQSLDTMSFAARISHMEARIVEIGLAVDDLTVTAHSTVTQAMSDIAVSGYYGTIYDIQRGTGSAFPIQQIDRALVQGVNAYPWSGATYSERLWKNRNNLNFQLRETLTQGLIRGDSTDVMSRELMRRLKSSKDATYRLVQTECAYAHAAATMDAYEVLGVEKFTFLATLDEHTCSECGTLDGQSFEIYEAQEGDNVPPIHPGCRCTTIPGDADDLTGERIARGHDGKTYKVDAGMSYEDWRQTFVKSGAPKAVKSGTMESKPAALPKVAKAPDARLQATLGDEQQMRGVVPKGAQLEHVRVIAGKGTSVTFRSAEAFAQKYGGTVADWRKKTGTVTGKAHKYEIHWTERKGAQHEAKIKRVTKIES